MPPAARVHERIYLLVIHALAGGARLFANTRKQRLKADKEKRIIEIDAVTSLTGVPKDPTIRERFKI